MVVSLVRPAHREVRRYQYEQERNRDNPRHAQFEVARLQALATFKN